MRVFVVLALCALAAWAAPARAENPALSRLGEGAPLAREKTVTRIGLGSCLRQDRPAPILGRIAQERFDVFIMAGDNVYGDTVAGGVSDAELNASIAAYAGLGARPDWRRFRAAQPLLAVWDDHDYGENDAGAGFPFREGTRRIFFDFWGGSAGPEQRGNAGVYGAYMLGEDGRRVQVLLLDTRSFRTPLKQGEPDAGGRKPYVPVEDPAATMLGAAQWSWLEKELRKPAELRLLVSSIQVLPLAHPFEKWANMPAERQKLLDLIARTKANGVVLLSGDRHRAIFSRETEGAPYPLTELTSSSLNLPFKAQGEETDRTSLGPYYEEVNYGAIEIDWAAGTVALAVRDLAGQDVRRETINLADLKVP